MTKQIATRESWDTTPMSSERAKLPIDLHMSPEEYERLKCGNIPEEMEDKWFVFHEDGWIYFHRSWTGYGIYQVRFELIGNEYVSVEGWVTRDSEQYNNCNIEEDVHLLNAIIFYLFEIGSDPSL